MVDLRLALMAGIDIPIQECQITVHQPTLEEIAFIGEEQYFIGVQSLTLNKTMFLQDKNLLDAVSNFQVFMAIMQEEATKEKRKAVTSVLQLLFPEYNALYTPASLIFSNKEKGNVTIDEQNFDIFQNYLKQVFCIKDSPMDKTSFNPANAKAKAIADKIMKGRQIVAAQKGDNNASIFSQYMSVLSVGLHIPIVEMKKITTYQLYDLMERYSMYMNWSLDVKVRLAGGSPDDHPDNWMKNIH